jgi:hypothetical protein
MMKTANEFANDLQEQSSEILTSEQELFISLWKNESRGNLENRAIEAIVKKWRAQERFKKTLDEVNAAKESIKRRQHEDLNRALLEEGQLLANSALKDRSLEEKAALFSWAGRQPDAFWKQIAASLPEPLPG